MARVLVFAYGLFAYGVFFATFLYAAGFVGNLGVPKSLDSAPTAPLGTALLIAFFLLAAGDTFRRKVARVAGPTLARRRIAITVLNDIDARIQRYMGTVLLTNALIALGQKSWTYWCRRFAW